MGKHGAVFVNGTSRYRARNKDFLSGIVLTADSCVALEGGNPAGQWMDCLGNAFSPRESGQQ